MHGVFHVVSGYVFHGCDCVIVCYTLRGKHIHSIVYRGIVIAWLLRRNIYIYIYIYIYIHGKIHMRKVEC